MLPEEVRTGMEVVGEYVMKMQVELLLSWPPLRGKSYCFLPRDLENILAVVVAEVVVVVVVVAHVLLLSLRGMVSSFCSVSVPVQVSKT